MNRQQFAPSPNSGNNASPGQQLGCAIVAAVFLLGLCGIGAWAFVSVVAR